MNRVLDAGAMVAYLDDEPGATVVVGLLADPDEVCYAHVVNLCEVFYGYRRDLGEEEAIRMLASLAEAGVRPSDDVDEAFWLQVGRLKSDPPRKSLADCFGLALAQRLGGEFVTTDHHELDALVPLGICPIGFIR